MATDVLADVQMEVETPEHVAIEYPLGGLGSRYCALLIDLLLVGLAYGGSFVALFLVLRMAAPLVAGTPVAFPIVFALLLVWLFVLQWGYFFCLEAFGDGRTVGKRLLGLRAVMAGGHPLTLEAAAVRNLLRPLDFFGGGLVGGFAMLLTPRLQRLGDLAAGTVVVRELPSEFPVVGEASSAVAPAPQLDDDLFAGLEAFMSRLDELAPAARDELAARLVVRVAESVPLDTNTDAETVLRTVYDQESARRLTTRLGSGERRPAALRLLRHKRERWEGFRALALRARTLGLSRLDEDAVATFAARYRELTADLARARTYGASPQTLFALERLVGIGHNVLYRPARRSLRSAWHWITRGFPTLVCRRWQPIALAAALMAVPALLTFALVHADPLLEDRLLSNEMLERAEGAPARKAAGAGYIDVDMLGGAVSSSFLATHNMGVAFNTFAGGILAGIGSALMLLMNGLHLGAVLGAYHNRGVLDLIGVFVLPHGVIELPAIVIAGGAGLWMGSALLLPGRLTRRAALAERATEAVSLIAGVIVMLLVAGLIEGYVSPSTLPDELKLLVAATMATGLGAYVLLGREPAADVRADRAA